MSQIIYPDQSSDTIAMYGRVVNPKIDNGVKVLSKDGETTIILYNNDIYVDWNTGVLNVHSIPRVFNYDRDYELVIPSSLSMIEVIGNVYTNPEVLTGYQFGHEIKIENKVNNESNSN